MKDFDGNEMSGRAVFTIVVLTLWFIVMITFSILSMTIKKKNPSDQK